MKLTFTRVGISSLGGELFLPVGLLYLIHVLGIPVSQAGLMMTATTTISLVATSVAGRMVDRVNTRVGTCESLECPDQAQSRRSAPQHLETSQRLPAFVAAVHDRG
jgi:MFS family permease